MSTMTSTHRQQWTIDIRREEGDDWPERAPRQYSRVGAEYKPTRVVFSYGKQGEGPITSSAVHISGPRYNKQDRLGVSVEETIWDHPSKYEPWLAKLHQNCLTQIEAAVGG